MLFNCIIVDDEPPAIKILERYIDLVPQLKLIKSCRNAFEAIKVLKIEKIDLMFLDIHLPKLIGTDFLKSLSYPPKVIFTTAHKDFSLKNFDLETVSYLLKPISLEQFLKAVNKFFTTDIIESQLEEKKEEFLYFRAGKKMIKVFLNSILYLEAKNDYLVIHRLNDTELKIKLPIDLVENMLPKPMFLRLHRDFIVSVEKITEFTSDFIRIGSREIPAEKKFIDDDKLKPATP